MIRIHYSLAEEYGGCIDLPDSCTLKMAICSHEARGYIRVVGVKFDDGHIRMLNTAGVLVIIENISVPSIKVETIEVEDNEEAVNV